MPASHSRAPARPQGGPGAQNANPAQNANSPCLITGSARPSAPIPSTSICAEPIIQSLRIAREQNARFPGFESDVHGLIIEQEGDVVSYKVEVLKA